VSGEILFQARAANPGAGGLGRAAGRVWGRRWPGGGGRCAGRVDRRESL